MSEDSEALMKQVHHRAYEVFVLNRIRSGGSVSSIFNSPVSVEQTARAIIGYLAIGIVEFADEPGAVDFVAPTVAAHRPV